MKLHERLFYLLLFFLPTQLGKHFWPDFAFIWGIRVDYLSPTFYLTDLLLLGLLGLWFWSEKKRINFRSGFWVFFLASFLFLVLNSFLAQNQPVAFYKLLRLIEFSFLAFYVSRQSQAFLAIKRVLPLVLIYSSLLALGQFLKQASLNGFFWWLGERTFNLETPGIALAEVGGRLFLRPYGTFSHPNSLAGFFLVSLFLTVPYWWPKKKLFAFVYTFLAVIVIFLSFSRSVWLIGLLTVFWLFWSRKGLILEFGLLIFLFGFSQNWISDQSVWERWQLLLASSQMIHSHPLSGVGLNNFLVSLPSYWQTLEIRFLQPVHNLYFLIAAETGLTGLLIFLWFLFLTIKRKIFLPLVVILLLGLFDHYWWTLPQNQILLALVWGLSWHRKSPKEVE